MSIKSKHAARRENAENNNLERAGRSFVTLRGRCQPPGQCNIQSHSMIDSDRPLFSRRDADFSLVAFPRHQCAIGPVPARYPGHRALCFKGPKFHAPRSCYALNLLALIPSISHISPLTQRFCLREHTIGLYKYASPLVLAHLCPMDYSTFMSSGLQAIAPRHTVHRRAHSASTMTVRPLPPIPTGPPAYRGHMRATSLDFRRADAQQRPSGPRRPQHAATEGDFGGRRPTPTGTPRPANGHRPANDDASLSYLSLDDSDSDSDSLPDELEDDIHATFIDFNESNSSLLLPQLVLPDSPHVGTTPIKPSAPPLNSFLSFTPAASPIDSPILAHSSQHFLLSPHDIGPALGEGTSQHLDSKTNQFERELVPVGERPEPPDDWREAVDRVMDEEDATAHNHA